MTEDATASSACTCWTVKTTDRGDAPLAWIGMHDEVRVETADGSACQGWPAGAGWWGPKETALVCFEVDVQGADTAVVPIEDVAQIEIIQGTTDLDAFLEKVHTAIRQASDDSPDLRLIIGDHEVIEVEIRRVKNRCEPGPRPAWLR